jgi:hypothetical protein
MKTLFQKLVNRVKLGKADAAFIDEVRLAFQDGILTDEERFWLQERHAELNASEAWWDAAPELYASAVRGATKAGALSEEAESQLKEIRGYLHLDADSGAQGDKLIEAGRQTRLQRIDDGLRTQQRLDWLEALRAGRSNIPPPPNVILRDGELVFLVTSGVAVEEKVVRREYAGGSRGVSIRVAKGVSFRVGNSRGHSVPISELVPISEGQLIITSLRVIFQGNPKSFADPIEKLIDIGPGVDGLRYSVMNRTKPRMVRYAPGTDYEAVLAALNGAVRAG